MALRKNADGPAFAPVDSAERQQAAEYIGRMAAELRSLAARSDLGFVGYLLGMVEEEASRLRKSPENG